MQQTLKVADISQFSPIEGEFPSGLNKTYDVCLCKIHIRMLPKGFLSCQFKPSKRPLLFLEFKKHLVVGQEKKRNTVCKNSPIIALDDL